MAPAPEPQPQPLTAPALEFLLLLGKAEAAVNADVFLRHGGSSASIAAFLAREGEGEEGEEDEDEDEEEEPADLRARVSAYGEALTARLVEWQGPTSAVAERYRSRVEELAPALERQLERRRQRRASSSVDQSKTPAEPALGAATAAGEPGDESATAGGGGTAAAASTAGGGGSGGGPSADDEASAPAPVLPCAVGTAVDLPWRHPSTARTRRGQADSRAAASARGNLEEEILDITEGMKGAASSFLASLKADNQTLSTISSMQDTNIDKVTKETRKGKEMLRSSQMGFFCTLVMLLTSIAIFFMTCMLIWIT